MGDADEMGRSSLLFAERTLMGELPLRTFSPIAGLVLVEDEGVENGAFSDASAVEVDAWDAVSLRRLASASLTLAFSSATLRPFLTTMDENNIPPRKGFKFAVCKNIIKPKDAGKRHLSLLCPLLQLLGIFGFEVRLMYFVECVGSGMQAQESQTNRSD